MSRTAFAHWVRVSLLASGLAGTLIAGTSAAQKAFLLWDGDSATDHLGYAVAGAGDVNADGFPM
jgi:hypothetical protein